MSQRGGSRGADKAHSQPSTFQENGVRNGLGGANNVKSTLRCFKASSPYLIRISIEDVSASASVMLAHIQPCRVLTMVMGGSRAALAAGPGRRDGRLVS